MIKCKTFKIKTRITLWNGFLIMFLWLIGEWFWALFLCSLYLDVRGYIDWSGILFCIVISLLREPRWLLLSSETRLRKSPPFINLAVHHRGSISQRELGRLMCGQWWGILLLTWYSIAFAGCFWKFYRIQELFKRVGDQFSAMFRRKAWVIDFLGMHDIWPAEEKRWRWINGRSVSIE